MTTRDRNDRPATLVGLACAGAWAAVLAFFAVLDAVGNLGALNWVKTQYVASNKFGQTAAITTLTVCLVLVGLVSGGRQWKHQQDARLHEFASYAATEREALTEEHRDALAAQAAQHRSQQEQLTRELEQATAKQVAAARGDAERRRRECEADVTVVTARLNPLTRYRERLDQQAGYGNLDLDLTTAVEVTLETMQGPEPIYDQRLSELLEALRDAAGRYNTVMQHDAMLSGPRGEEERKALLEASSALGQALDTVTARLHELKVEAGIKTPLPFAIY